MMKIQVEVEIFDDPEHCEDYKNSCAFSSDDDWYCQLFLVYIRKTKPTLQKTSCGIEYKSSPIGKKCDQCKTAYQKAKGD